MKILQSELSKVLFTGVILALCIGHVPTVGAAPVPGPELSAPIIRRPIYDCAQVIAFSGICRDSTIIVYVNGKPFHSVNTAWGEGETALPSPLKKGDVVSARQVVNNRISAETSEPVHVTEVPVLYRVGGRLNRPKVLPPLYECQQVVRVNVLEGAEVILRNVNGKTWKGRTAYNRIYFGLTPPLASDDEWFVAVQDLCAEQGLPSYWSRKVWVENGPASLPDPIKGRLVSGADALLLKNLTPGADVVIYADDGSGEVRVGGGPARDTASIFWIHPPIDLNSRYRPVQSLCGVTGVGRKEYPEENPSPPTIQEPICAGSFYVTICDTVPRSTIKVYADGTQVAQAAGNGECVTMALGNKARFSKDQKVKVIQEVDGKPSKPSGEAIVADAGLPPDYNPTLWNDMGPDLGIRDNNCYNYACDIKTDTNAQPGLAHGTGASDAGDCQEVELAAMADGLKKWDEQTLEGCTHLVALFVDRDIHDYHWYRLDSSGRWSHKFGQFPATDLDASDKPILNPETADRTYVFGPAHAPDFILDYETFCGYYVVDKKVVNNK
ncbi:MAG: hypothetical protein JSV56_04415 [Methanomassiliicoccales archaeon]|nr:MAG: hypothetical protein JSV56_04415 [Methanomassiliicoccales archaeon]